MGDRIDIGRVGVWAWQLRSPRRDDVRAMAAELEARGYSALWVPGGIGGDVFGDAAHVLASTERVAVATGVVNIWAHTADEISAGAKELLGGHPGRFLLGLGVSHGPLVDAGGERRYRRPLATMTALLDHLDNAGTPPASRLLAALGPRMLELARSRSAGAHPYLVTPEHTARARELLGPRPLLAVEQAVALERDPATARARGREHLAVYLGLPNYVNNWRRLGFGDGDVEGGGSDALVDALVAWGDEERIAARVRAHLDAGADHVCIQVASDFQTLPAAEWRALAPALTTL